MATGGRGVYKLDVNTYMSEPYITADYGSYNGMNGNNINDVYVDEEDRIWLANYPTGITIRNNRYGSYDLIRHSLGNTRSLVNDQVHDVVEDTEITLQDLCDAGFSREVVETVEILTKRQDMTYFDYIDDIHWSETASKIKIAEIEDNLDIMRVKKCLSGRIQRKNAQKWLWQFCGVKM